MKQAHHTLVNVLPLPGKDPTHFLRRVELPLQRGRAPPQPRRLRLLRPEIQEVEERPVAHGARPGTLQVYGGRGWLHDEVPPPCTTSGQRLSRRRVPVLPAPFPQQPLVPVLLQDPLPFHPVLPAVLIDYAQTRLAEVDIRVPPVQSGELHGLSQRHASFVEGSEVQCVAFPLERLAQAFPSVQCFDEDYRVVVTGVEVKRPGVAGARIVAEGHLVVHRERGHVDDGVRPQRPDPHVLPEFADGDRVAEFRS
mmetsp:Transcript_20373/g.43667  ORF Transcript_20373/g.43667 Transcript_20373/m.43667 type:complete len:252 (-) Transcript_20373:867-1622(-)